METNYPFNKQLKHRNTRRARFCNYIDRGFFMITLTAANGIAPFSYISGTPTVPVVKTTALGTVILSKIASIPIYTPQLRVLDYIVMPDHLHMFLEIRDRLPRHLGKVIGGFMGGCTAEARKASIIAADASVFTNKFHDRVVTGNGQIARIRKYIHDNPQRLLIKRLHPDLFRQYLHLEIGGHEYAAYGNIFLLRHYNLLPVRIHRRWSASEFEAYESKCLTEIEKGAVAISPFIHQAEKRIRAKALEYGASVIQLCNQGFEARFKPQGEEFALCAEGRLLLLAPWPDNVGRRSTAGYTEFHTMNDLAAMLAGISVETRMNIVDLHRER